MKALIVIDMLNDFVTGVLANEKQATEIIPVIQRVINYARNQPDWLVVYANDAHYADDREMGIWGKHAMAGTWGAEVVDALAPIGSEREIVSPKHFYSAFDGTDLDEVFGQYGVTEVVLTGQHTNCCVRHTAYSAFTRGYGITVLSDAVCVLPEVDHSEALDYLKTVYGVEITTSTELGVPSK
ncbi:cysteine hydrolase family protein [Xenorhabdus doucetiae]|uniref:Nicotinamidase-related amidase n=1 Tax=Xenorhabdus doucetiae TaxID=351671 RepID=A0A068QVI8_9GAMM|nr:isochorismatase family cysteine hydrolase [Xenorhabdus doucetiae]TYO96705.1 nicotinamidase-related amidase [Xenorhabdus doucetiae]CDG18769.1 putative Isochorismatase [Xenorhabdus doucetiae]